MNNEEPQFGKNYWIALVLSMAILLGYPALMEKLYPPPPVEPTGIEESAPREVIRQDGQEIKEAVQTTVLKEAEGPFLETADKPTVIPFENERYQVEFTTLGGAISRLNYKGDLQTDDRLIGSLMYDRDPAESNMLALKLTNEEINLARANFKLTKKDLARQVFEFTYEKSGEYRIIKRYRFDEGVPSLNLDIDLENLSNRERHFPIELNYGLSYDLESTHDSRFVEGVVKGEKTKKANVGKIAKKGYAVNGTADWSGILKKYFVVMVKTESPTINHEFASDGETIVHGRMRLSPITVQPGRVSQETFLVYAGAQRYEVLKSYDAGLEGIMSRGMLGGVKVWLVNILKFFNDYTHNYGWAIIILTLIIKGAFTPLTHMSFENMKKMQVLQPKLKALQERYKTDANKLNQEMMQLYRRNKVNPMMGCLPMLMQIPIFIAFYQGLSEAIELKGAPFIFWMQDLSQPDKLVTLPFEIPFLGDGLNVLPILMIFSMVWQQKLTPTAAASPEQAKMMAWMPIIFGFMFYAMPSGLVLYWFVNNVLSVIHQVFIKRINIVLHHEDRDEE